MHYFESHPIIVVMSHGLGEIINNQNAFRKIVKWALELMGLDITYVPYTAIKSFFNLGHCLSLRVPNAIIANNNLQFTGKKFLWFFNEFNIQVHWAAIAHPPPPTNGQVEPTRT
jgi:hypothetical protein